MHPCVCVYVRGYVRVCVCACVCAHVFYAWKRVDLRLQGPNAVAGPQRAHDLRPPALRLKPTPAPQNWAQHNTEERILQLMRALNRMLDSHPEVRAQGGAAASCARAPVRVHAQLYVCACKGPVTPDRRALSRALAPVFLR